MSGVPVSSRGSTFNGGTITSGITINGVTSGNSSIDANLPAGKTTFFNGLDSGGDFDLYYGIFGLFLDLTQGGLNGNLMRITEGDDAGNFNTRFVVGAGGDVTIGGKSGFYGSAPAARQTLHSATATPEQIALALEASTLMTGD